MIQSISSGTLRFTDWCEQKLSTRYWALIITGVTLLIALFFSFPSYQSFKQVLATESRPAQVSQQISNLLSYWRTNSGTNTAFRITVPIISSLLGLDIRGAYALQFIAGILLFYVIARIAERESHSRVFALFVTLSVGGLFAGVTAFWEFRSKFDGVALLFLLIAMWSESPLVIFPSILLAGFTDERALVATGFVFLWWFYRKNRQGESVLKSLFNRQTISILGALLIYLVARLAIARIFNVTTYSQATSEFRLLDQINLIPMGLWTGLEASWLVIVIAVFALISRKHYLMLGLFSLFVLLQSVLALSVNDITRSMAYLLPAYILAFRISLPELKDDLRTMIPYIATLNLLMVNYVASGKSTIWWIYPLPVQIVRWILGT